MKRRHFLQTAALLTGAPGLLPVFGNDQFPDLVVVMQKNTPQELVNTAIESLGGMSRFVSRGDVVVLKPNMSWDRVPEQAATTNPDVVSVLVKLCLEAGAKKVKIFDNTLNEPNRCYKRSGIEKAGKAAGASVEHVHPRKFKQTKFPDGELIKSWDIYKDILEADKIINVPCAKHHSIGGVSLGMKNLMGVIGGNRGKFHRDFHTKIVDLSTLVKPDLIVLDAYRMLMRNGPSGGNLADVTLKECVVAGTDPVAVDSYGVKLFEQNPKEKSFLVLAEERGLGTTNLDQLKIKTIAPVS